MERLLGESGWYVAGWRGFWGGLVFGLDSVSQMDCLQNHLKKYIIVHVQIVAIYLAGL